MVVRGVRWLLVVHHVDIFFGIRRIRKIFSIFEESTFLTFVYATERLREPVFPYFSRDNRRYLLLSHGSRELFSRARQSLGRQIFVGPLTLALAHAWTPSDRATLDRRESVDKKVAFFK